MKMQKTIIAKNMHKISLKNPTKKRKAATKPVIKKAVKKLSKYGRYLSPYQRSGKTTWPEIQNKSGYYVIKENNIIVYVGYSASNLYKTMYRHFQTWNHGGQEVITYANKHNTYKVKVTLCAPVKANKEEIRLIKKYKPRDNKQFIPETRTEYLKRLSPADRKEWLADEKRRNAPDIF